MRSGITVIVITIVLISLLMAGCSNWNRTTTGAVVGAGAGTAAGAVIGKTLGSTTAGALAGAAVGGTVGAIIGRQMDQKAEEMARELDGVEIQRVEEGIAISFDSGILFDFDSADLRGEARSNLRKLADILGEDEDTNLMIVGHTDWIGDANYNMGLSERRARSAADYLVSQGISRYRIDVEGRGETEPIGDNETDEGRQQNRRVEVAIFASDEYVAELEREHK